MRKVLILGAGKIGRMIASYLGATSDYAVTVADVDESRLARIRDLVPRAMRCHVDATNSHALQAALSDQDVAVSALSFYLNPQVAQAAQLSNASYFDLTEDVETTRAVRKIAESAADGQIFMPQCGLAPGFISIIANHLAKQFDELDSVRMRVGALPQFPTDALKYNLTWSTDGLINEYLNACDAIHLGKRIDALPLEGLEHFSLDGARYEAFNTSGGLGTLCETLQGNVRELNYKTIRYLGHCDLIRFLVEDLRLGDRRELLKDIFEHAIPVTFQDVVVTFCTVKGRRKGQFVQLSDARKIYSQPIAGENWSAIQVTTAAGICAAIDLHLQGKLPRRGFVKQEDVNLDDFLANRFGRHYQCPIHPQLEHEFVGVNDDV
ncbi:MAG: saccharopine dehydrogenase NADP-binding domain-containing protein [Pirellulaceae bacterium]